MRKSTIEDQPVTIFTAYQARRLADSLNMEELAEPPSARWTYEVYCIGNGYIVNVYDDHGDHSGVL